MRADTWKVSGGRNMRCFSGFLKGACLRQLRKEPGKRLGSCTLGLSEILRMFWSPLDLGLGDLLSTEPSSQRRVHHSGLESAGLRLQSRPWVLCHELGWQIPPLFSSFVLGGAALCMPSSHPGIPTLEDRVAEVMLTELGEVLASKPAAELGLQREGGSDSG